MPVSLNSETQVSRIHKETGTAWEILAQAGYGAEIAKDVEFIRNGGISLMDPERRLLDGLETWCHCALHLQCSGGKDLLSIWNMGASKIVGVDISETLIGYARQKSDALNAPATWYCCDVLETPHELNGSADLVYTGRGALMWMMDLGAWARVVERLLSPTGRILVFEGHPLDNLWQRESDSFEVRPDGISYFPARPNENPGFPSSVIIRETGNDAERPKMLERCWRPGQVINALASVGLEYVHFDEYPDLFWNQFWRIPRETTDRLPHTYSVLMKKSPKKTWHPVRQAGKKGPSSRTRISQRYKEASLSNHVKVTVIGAGSIVFSLGLVKDICLTEGLSGSQICFMDIADKGRPTSERLEVIHKLAVRYAEDLGADLSFESTLDREASLQDADFVINTATISHNEYLMRDVRNLAARHGYFYGHTGMPEYHNLRLMLDVAQDVARICPNAWILQAGNPVFAGTTLMHRETGVKVCGLCHGHYGYRRLASTLGLDPDAVTWQAPGLNHNIWLTHFHHGGQDAYPLIDAWIENEAEAYWQEKQAASGIPTQMSPAAVHQYKMFGLMPIGDTPRSGGWWYHVDMETRMRWYGGPGGGGDTPEGRDRVIAEKETKYEEMVQAAYDANVRPIELFGDRKTSEQHVPIIDGLVNNHEGWFQVNVPNQGALAGLPDDVAVEVPAVVNAKGIQPLRVGALPPKVMLERILPTWLSMERNLEAFRSGDKSMLLYGILDSHQTRTYDQAVELLDALLAMPKTEPMAYVKDINEHFHYPDIW